MSGTTEPLILDFLGWLAAAPRRYADVMDAWRTSCPRLTVWEDAIDRGLVAHCRRGEAMVIEVTPRGRQWLEYRESVSLKTAQGLKSLREGKGTDGEAFFAELYAELDELRWLDSERMPPNP